MSMRISVRRPLALAAVAGAAMTITGAASGQVNCGGELGPDLVVGDITGPSNYAGTSGNDAFSAGLAACNYGNLPVNVFSNTNQHYVVGQNLFRLTTVNGAGRFEQIGMSWLFHSFFPLQSAICCTCTVPSDPQTLGVGCSDPHTAARCGTQSGLSPRWQMNAATGAFNYPPANPPFSGSVARRLHAANADIDPALNPGAQYSIELFAIAPDDATAGNSRNNASHRRVLITGSDPSFTLSLTGSTQRGRPAILAWRDADPAVTVVNADVADDGRFIVAARATNVGTAGGALGRWQFEYAVYNMNSHRSGQSFSVPIAAEASIAGIGFHDVSYHSGDGPGNVDFDGTDWPATLSPASVSWATQAFDANPSANALRFNTLYNFRFRTDHRPGSGVATLGLFRTGAPGTVDVPGVPVPSGSPCLGDFNGDGASSPQDVFDFLAAFFQNSLAADANGDLTVSSQDIFTFLSAFFSGC